MQIFTHPKYISKFIIIIIIKLKYHETGESTSMIKVGGDGAACLLNTKIKKIFDEGLGAARGFLSFPPLLNSPPPRLSCIALQQQQMSTLTKLLFKHVTAGDLARIKVMPQRCTFWKPVANSSTSFWPSTTRRSLMSPATTTNPLKTTLCFSITDKVGALDECLSAIKSMDISLTRIES